MKTSLIRFCAMRVKSGRGILFWHRLRFLRQLSVAGATPLLPLLAILLSLSALSASAVDFPLNRYDMTVSESLALPAAPGAITYLTTARPRALTREPIINGIEPLYGSLVCASNFSLLFRLDSANVAEETLLFASDSFVNATNLIKKLAAQSHPLSQFLWNRFSVDSRKNLLDAKAPATRLQSVLTEEFNNVIRGKSIYMPLRFQQVRLSAAAVSLGSQTLSGDPLLRFNRLLLECAYPLEIRKSNPSIGYTQLILDMNGNGDLTDDTVYQSIPSSEMPSNRMSRNPVFGPIPCPEVCVTGGWDPQWFAVLELYAGGNSGSTRGVLRRQVATIMEADVQLGRFHTKMAILDADANFHLGEPLRGEAGYLTNPNQLLASPGDKVMIDYNQSGKYEETEILPLSTMVVLAGTRFRLMLCDDLCNVTLETPPQAMDRFAKLFTGDSSSSSLSYAGARGAGFGGATRIVAGGSAGSAPPPQAKTPTPG